MYTNTDRITLLPALDYIMRMHVQVCPLTPTNVYNSHERVEAIFCQWYKNYNPVANKTQSFSKDCEVSASLGLSPSPYKRGQKYTLTSRRLSLLSRLLLFLSAKACSWS